MGLFVYGLNHQTASIALREKIAFTAAAIPDALNSIKSEIEDLSEVLILSTCNRTEIYGNIDSSNCDSIAQWISNRCGISLETLQKSSYQYYKSDVLKHLIHVTCGIDSQIFGETQIQKQVKDACLMAQEANTIHAHLWLTIQSALHTAKKIRTKTCINQYTTSIGKVAATLAIQIWGDLRERKIMLVGAGKTISLVAKYLVNDGNASNLTILNRSLANAKTLAETYQATPLPLSQLTDQISQQDIIVCCTSSDTPIITKQLMEQHNHNAHNEKLLIDLAVPRDIDPSTGELPNIHLYALDDLNNIIDTQVEHRQAILFKVQQLIEVSTKQYEKNTQMHAAGNILHEYRRYFQSIQEEETQHALQKLSKGNDPKEIIEKLAKRLTSKLLHIPTIQMREASLTNNEALMDLINSLHKIPNEDTTTPKH